MEGYNKCKEGKDGDEGIFSDGRFEFLRRDLNSVTDMLL